TSLGSPAIPCSTPWWRRPPLICASITRKDEATQLCELPVPGRQLETAAQSGGSARMFAAAGRRRDRHVPGGRHPLRRHLAQGLGTAHLRERLLPTRADGEPDQAA